MTERSVAFPELPAPRVVPGARARIRAAHRESGRRIVVFDDDPTGSQTVHGAAVVTSLEPDQLRVDLTEALAEAGSTCFVLTNTRSLAESDAVALNVEVARVVGALGMPVEAISRSDSTLRGHVVAEVRALDTVERERTGRGYDGMLLVPAYFEAGRLTAGNIHWARAAGELVPVGQTEFARDATFGYASSDLRDFVSEKSGGEIAAGDVASIGIDDIRLGGPERVAEILTGVDNGQFVVVNATDYADLEVVVLGLLDAEAAGRRFAYRTGPSFVRALAGMEPSEPLTRFEPAGRHGLVVVGSHVGLTNQQVERVRADPGVVEIALDVNAVVDPARRDAEIAAVGERVRAQLADSDVMLITSRDLRTGTDAGSSLDIARRVSAAVVDVVHVALRARPGWVIAKGGITSHDVAVKGLGIRRAEVLGQLLPGLVSVWRPVEAAAEAIGVPYVVFAGNVGDETTLAYAVHTLRGAG